MAALALVTYLRMEADLADEKARRLREQADQLSQQYGISLTDTAAAMGSINNISSFMPSSSPQCEMAPLDEHGVPKYKGKKRGRKPKPRKQKINPNRPRRQHTAYTLFVQEHYPSIKASNPNLQSKDLISIVAKQWAAVSALEKQAWKQRASETTIIHDADKNNKNDGDGDNNEDVVQNADTGLEEEQEEQDENIEVGHHHHEHSNEDHQEAEEEADDDDDEQEEYDNEEEGHSTNLVAIGVSEEGTLTVHHHHRQQQQQQQQQSEDQHNDEAVAASRGYDNNNDEERYHDSTNITEEDHNQVDHDEEEEPELKRTKRSPRKK